MAGEGDIRDGIAAATEPMDGEEIKCPVIALGSRDRIYYFIGLSGEIHALGPRDFTPMGLVTLFDGDTDWLYKVAPKRDNEDNVTGFLAQKAATILIRKCADVGLWNPETPIRSIGIWRGEKQSLVIHAGDAVLITGETIVKWHPAGRHIGSAIYVAAPPIARPAAQPAPEAIAATFRKAFDNWAYAHATSPKMLFGWTVAAMLGAAPAWRSNVLITSERGSGKSALTKLVRAALGPQARALNNFSEAGLRQIMTRESLAIVLDEAEGKVGDGDRINAVIELIRQMTGDDGVQGVRGTAGGTAQSFSLASPTWLSAINPPALLPQDRSRIFEIELMKPEPRGYAAAQAAVEFVATHSEALRARVIAGWPRFLDNMAVYREALIATGCDGRQADQLGTMLSAAEMMLSDQQAMSDTAAEDVALLLPLIQRLLREDAEESDPLQCFSTLMTRLIEHWAGGSRSTVGRLIYNGLDPTDSNARKSLRVYGLRLEIDDERSDDHPFKKTGARLFIANQHEGLRQIFRDTRWRDGGWRRSLLRLSGAAIAPEPVSFDGYKARCIIIPGEHLPEAPAKAPEQKPASPENDSHPTESHDTQPPP